MTTMGSGDLPPRPEWLRLLVAFQSLTGFALLTASVSWIVAAVSRSGATPNSGPEDINPGKRIA